MDSFAPMKRRWFVLACVTVSYMLAFMQRTGPGVISNQLQSQFHITATLLGTMVSIQYLLYMILQIPVGLFGDKYGPEKLLAAGVLLDGIGTLVFATAHAFVWLLFGRAIVGLGDALIWVNIVLILGKWFLPQEFGSLLGVVSIGGNFGALLTTIPFAAWVSVAGWRLPFVFLGALLCVTAGVSYAVFTVGTRGKSGVAGETKQSQTSLHVVRGPLSGVMKQVLRDRTAWATCACHFGAVGTYIGFVGLWAVPYFMSTYQLPRAEATWFTLTAFIGALLGGPITGAVSDKIGRRRLPYMVLQSATTLSWLSFVVWIGQPPEWVALVAMFIIGFGSGGSLLTFATIRDVTLPARSGVTSGFANTGGFLSAVLLPVIFGFVIDMASRVQHGSPANHVPASAYALAFLVPTAFSFVGVVGTWILRESGKGKIKHGNHSIENPV